MIITRENKVILAKFIDPEQKERSKEEAEKIIENWMQKTCLYSIGSAILFKIRMKFYEKNNVAERA